jgi:thioredoxin-like negative regulator of GroEL
LNEAAAFARKPDGGSPMKNVNDAEFESVVLQSPKPVLVKFTAEW